MTKKHLAAVNLVKRWAHSAADRAGTTEEFFMVQMNYSSLVFVVRSLMSPRGRCCGCGYPCLGEHDIQFFHRDPPLHERDWERLRAGNLFLGCASCVKSIGAKPFDVWLDEQWVRTGQHATSRS